MDIEVQLANWPIAEKIFPPTAGAAGAWVEFRGLVRGEENGEAISALEYEAYPEMAEREIRRLLAEISVKHTCFAAKVIHRVGIVPVGETAIYIGVAAKHRGTAFALLAEFMDRLKQDVPIWKRRAIVVGARPCPPNQPQRTAAFRSLVEAVAEIQSHCKPLPPVRVPLEEAFGRVLRETVCASEDLPSCDRSTRDGYAILQNDTAESFQVVDVIHAAGWKPRQLQFGEAVRVATGAALPCGGLRVVMQENVERSGDKIKIIKRESPLNLRKRGEDVTAGEPLVQVGARLDAGKLALLASAGCAQPLVSPRLRVVHFTTGDEIIPPAQTPQPGQVRDSNSILIRSLLQCQPCEVFQAHLPEDFERAKSEIGNRKSEIDQADVVLVSGGASVGEKDFTRPLLEWLGFETVFSQVNVRPGKPLIFGMDGGASVPASRLVGSLASPNKFRVAFGLPGNPLSHFVCFHFAVATALAKLTGEEPPGFLSGRLAVALADAACPRETLWPAQLKLADGAMRLRPLPWASSGDVTCFAEANALLRVPANCDALAAGAEVDFLPVGGMMGA
jgi:molybdopterin molybdotransferase